MSLTGDFSELDRLVAYFRNLGQLARTRGVQAAAKAVEGVARAQYAAGQGPDGQSWPRNKDGSIPLQGPTREMRFTATEGRIEIKGPDVLQYHQEGGGNLPRRPVFPPAGQFTKPWADAADEAMRRVLEEGAPK